ncbi:MAG TPA: cation transporter [Gammaproteobacteria bacterium]|nr:cation transporter [Gammaproteobacteria bacterium]
MGEQCGCGKARFDGVDRRYITILWVVIALNGLMFFVEMTAGFRGQSQALKADALDFLGDSLTYGISLWVIGKSVNIRTSAAMLKGISLFLMAGFVLVSTAYRLIVLNSPHAFTMSTIGFLALAANLFSVMLLMRYKDGDANIRSVWLCSRNDAVGNVAVMLAAAAVWYWQSPWPDLLVALLMAGLFFSSATQILRQALDERREAQASAAA